MPDFCHENRYPYRAMKQFSRIVLCAATFALALSATSQKVELKDSKGQDVGTATISKSGQGVKIHLDLMNLPRRGGYHGDAIRVARLTVPAKQRADPKRGLT